MYRYKVDCWINPESRHVLIERDRVLKIMQKAAKKVYPDSHNIHKAIEQFDEAYENMVLESFLIESDSEIGDCEKDIVPEIRKIHPEARFASFSPLLPKEMDGDEDPNFFK